MIDISVIIPAYNAASIIARSVGTVDEYLGRNFASHEIIVVDDGSDDETPEILRSLAEKVPALRVVALPENRGKGRAVRSGMLAASGDVRAFTDADLPYSLKAIKVAAQLIAGGGFDLVVGDRTLPGSNYYSNVSLLRRVVSRTLSFVTRLMLTGEQFDTQCGFKAFRGEVAEALFSLTRVDDFAFDVEILYIALHYNLPIRRIPVRFTPRGGSSVRLAHDVPRMLRSIVRLPFNWYGGLYAHQLLEERLTMNYWTEPPNAP